MLCFLRVSVLISLMSSAMREHAGVYWKLRYKYEAMTDARGARALTTPIRTVAAEKLILGMLGRRIEAQLTKDKAVFQKKIVARCDLVPAHRDEAATWLIGQCPRLMLQFLTLASSDDTDEWSTPLRFNDCVRIFGREKVQRLHEGDPVIYDEPFVVGLTDVRMVWNHGLLKIEAKTVHNTVADIMARRREVLNE